MYLEMSSFSMLRGLVYILENVLACRVKLGVTINSVYGRLESVNDMWQGKKATCQICGTRRLVDLKGFVPFHVSSSIIFPERYIVGRGCPGGDSLPLEKDRMLALKYLDSMKNYQQQVSGKYKSSVTRVINNLTRRINVYNSLGPAVGHWEVRATYRTDCAEKVEQLSHKLLRNTLDRSVTFGEVFSCSVSDAKDAVEESLRQLSLFDSAIINDAY
jgi:hypothetical protein